jgi:hypothetical protein
MIPIRRTSGISHIYSSLSFWLVSLTIVASLGYRSQRVQYKRLEKEVDEASGVEAVQPNKRLNQVRLEKLQSIGFAWSAKNVRKPKPSAPDGPPKPKKAPADDSASRTEARNRLADSQWEEMYQRLEQYKEKHFVSSRITNSATNGGLFFLVSHTQNVRHPETELPCSSKV